MLQQRFHAYGFMAGRCADKLHGSCRVEWIGRPSWSLGPSMRAATPAFGDHTPSCAQLLSNLFGDNVVVDVRSGGRQRFVLPGAAIFAVGKNIIELKSILASNPLGRST